MKFDPGTYFSQGKWIRPAVWTALILTLLLAAAGTGLLVLDSPYGKRHLTNWLNGELGDDTSGIEIGEISGTLLGTFRIDSIRFKDDKGTWAELRAIRASWAPWKLVAGTVHISSLQAKEFNVSRRPSSTKTEAPAEPSSPLALPSLPVDLRIDEFDLPEINLQRPVTGRTTQLTSYGRFSETTEGQLVLGFLLARLGDIREELALDLTFDRPTDFLAIDGQLYIPARGLIAALSGTDLDEDFAVLLKGKGPRHDWAGRLIVQQGEVELGEALISNSKEVFSISADIDPAKQEALRDVELLGNKLRLAVLLKPEQEKNLKHLSIELETHAARLKADGRLHTEDLTVLDNVGYTAELKQAFRFNGASLDPLLVRGAVNGTFSRPVFTLATDKVVFHTEDDSRFEIATSLQGEMTDRGIRFSNTGQLRNILIPGQVNLDHYIPLPVSWQGQGTINLTENVLLLEQLTAGNDLQQLQVTGSVGLAGQKMSLQGSLASSLDHLADRLAGALNVDFSLEQQDQTTPLVLDLTLKGKDLALGDALMDGLVGATPAGTIRTTVNPDNSLGIAADLKAAHVGLTTELDIDPDSILKDSPYRLSFTDLDKLKGAGNLKLAGKLDIAGTLSGPLASPNLTAETGLKNLTLQDLTLSDLVLVADVKDVAQSLAGTVRLSGKSNYGPLNLSVATSRSADNIIHLTDISALAGPLQAEGNLNIPSGAPLSGQFTLSTQPPNKSPGEVVDLFEGTLSAALTLEDRDGYQAITTEGSAKDLRLALPSGDILGMGLSRWSGRWMASDNLPALDLSAEVQGLSLPDIELGKFALNLAREGRKTSFDTEATGTEDNPLALTAKGNLQQSETGILILTSNLDGQLNNIPVSSLTPLTLEKQGQTLTLKPTRLALGEGQLEIAFSRAADKLMARLVASMADFRILNNLVPDLPFTGILDGTADVSASADNLSGQAELTLTRLDTPYQLYAIDPALKLDLAIGATGDKLTLKGGLDLAADRLITLSAELPTDYDYAARSYSLNQTAPMTAQLDWAGEIAPLWPMLNLYHHDLSGTTQGRVTVGGSVRDFLIGGEINLEGGRYENIQSGFVADNIELKSSISDNKLTLEHFTATDGGEGTLGADGWVSFTPDLSYRADMKVRADRARLYRQPSLEIMASTELSLTRDGERLLLNGSVEVNSADINLVDQGPGSLIETDVVEINDGHDADADEEALKKRHLGPLVLDLALKAPKRVFVRGRGLDSEWAGDLEITGSSEEAIVNGTISLVRGTFDFSGKRFNLTRGEIRFPGNASNDPKLDIESELNMANLDAFINIGGTAAQPTLAITSSPELPQDEILSRILFGTSVTELSAWEALQLASSIQALSGSGGPGMLDRMRGGLGIDRLSIGSDVTGEHGTLISGGKYISNNIYVEITTSSTTGATAQSVEVDLTKSLSLVTKRTLDQDNSLSIRWSWDY